jgi:hypothetical protein
MRINSQNWFYWIKMESLYYQVINYQIFKSQIKNIEVELIYVREKKIKKGVFIVVGQWNYLVQRITLFVNRMKLFTQIF